MLLFEYRSREFLRDVIRVGLLPVTVFVSVQQLTLAGDDAVSLVSEVNVSRVTDVDYSIEISGKIVTPSAAGDQQFPLKSTGEFQFQNHPFPSDAAAPFSLRAIRRFETASTSTTVGKDHTTDVALSSAYRTVYVSGSEQGLLPWSPGYALPRKQLDLLQMPFDILAASSLLPSTVVTPGDKWNTDAWLVPMLTGIEAVVQQSATCELKSIDDDTAVIAFAGSVDGAVQGSASKVSFSGSMTIDRALGIVASLNATQKEKRSPGPVSPGLDVTAIIQWTQTAAQLADSAPSTMPEGLPSDRQLQLYLQTPLKLRLRHSREWYLFHETPSVLMMRQLRDGNLVSQCNISGGITVPPKQHTPDTEFLADVTDSVRERKGRVALEKTVRDDGNWRIRHIQAVGDAAGQVIIWDYYLCSAATGEQFSIVFSHAKEDENLFGEEASNMLSTLQIARRRPLLPFR